MSILGKILIAFNLLLGVGVIWLAAQVQAKRQQWSFALLEHELLYAGLPVDPPSATVAENGEAFVPIGIVTQKGAYELPEIRRTVLQKMFDKYKGGAELGVVDDPTFSVPEKDDNRKFVTSQQKELERVSDKVFAALDRPVAGQPPTDAQKLARLRSWLLSLSATGSQRDGINALTSDLFVPSLAQTARAELPLAATLDEQSTALRRIADAVAEGKDPAAVEQTRVAELAEAVRRAATDSERKALELLSKLIAALPEGPERVKTALETARLLLLARFELAALPSATSPGEVSGDAPGKLSSGDKRFRIASLLYNLDPIDPAQAWDNASSPLLTDADVLFLSQAQSFLANEQNRSRADAIFRRVRGARLDWIRRVRFIVGADTYRQVAEARVSDLLNAASRINDVLRQEDAAIRPRHALLVAEAQALADEYDFNLKAAASQQAIVNGYRTALKAREEERDQLKMSLTEERRFVVDKLAALDVEERKLFVLQAELVKLQDRLFALETSVRELELKTPPTRSPK